jgi:tellurite resistance protein
VIAKILTAIAMLAQIGFTLYIMGRWFTKEFSKEHCNPSCFIPVVGNVLVSVPAGKLGWTELAWGFWSIALLFWVVMMTNNFSKLVFGNPLPDKFMPFLFIMIAPPAIFGLGYEATFKTGGDLVTRMMTWLAVFFFLLMLRLARQYYQVIKKKWQMTFFAFGFPTCSLTQVWLEYHHYVDTDATNIISIALFIFSNIVIILLVSAYFYQAVKGNVYIPDNHGPQKPEKAPEEIVNEIVTITSPTELEKIGDNEEDDAKEESVEAKV